jgi:hypothetical protein
VIAGLLLVALASAADGADETLRGERWSVSGSFRIDAPQAQHGEPYRPEARTLALQRRIDESASARAWYEYRSLDLPRIGGIAADTNGHVHRLALGWGWDTPQVRFGFGPKLGVSSNALKHPKDLQLADLRWHGLAAHRVGASGWAALHVDDRFGRTRLYPGFTWRFEPTASSVLQLGFPDSAWRWQAARHWRIELALGPQGGRWRVRDREFLRRTDVRVRSWEAAWQLLWRPFSALDVGAVAGRRFDATLRYRLRDGNGAYVEPRDSFFFGVEVSVRL